MKVGAGVRGIEALNAYGRVALDQMRRNRRPLNAIQPNQNGGALIAVLLLGWGRER